MYIYTIYTIYTIYINVYDYFCCENRQLEKCKNEKNIKN